jgi:hypothetical protein
MIQLPLGVVIYDGPSMLDGKPILAIATGFRKTDNPKTGEMLQVWIMRKDMKPTDAVVNGEDASVCGNCFHRKAKTCYVTVFQAPYQVWKNFYDGKYGQYTTDVTHFSGRLIRLGAYGDPASVPMEVWRRILAVAKGHTAYTHQWRNRNIDSGIRDICMASCDTLGEATRAKLMGWKPFRIIAEGEILANREFLCPASEEAGKKRTCATCGACGGGVYRGQATPAIFAHGGGGKGKRFNRIRIRQRSKKGWQDLVPVYATK